MAITNVEILKTRLTQAEEAYHKLMIGEKGSLSQRWQLWHNNL